ncbi:MAG: putative GH25 family protein, partial [Planctomycetota bacterium]
MGVLILLSFGAWGILSQEDSQDDLSNVEIVDGDRDDGIARRSEKPVNKAPIGGVIKGRILDSKKMPVAALIRLKLGAPPGTKVGEMEPTILEFRTSSNGTFVSPVTGYHLVSMVVVPQSGAPMERQLLKLAGQDLDLGSMTVATGGTIRGQVVGEDGDPVAGASVTVGGRAAVADRNGVGQFILGIDAETARETETDTEGNFSVAGIASGRISVIVDAQGYQPSSQSNIVLKDGASETLEFELEISRSLTIEIRDETTRDLIPRAVIQLSVLDYRPSDQILRAFNDKTLTVEKTEILKFEGLCFRRYRIRVFANGYVVSEDRVIGSKERTAVILMSRCGEAYGRVFDAESGESISGYVVSRSRVSARQLGGDFEILDSEACAKHFELNPDVGFFGIRNGQNNSVRLTFSAKGYATGSVDIESLASGERRRLEVALNREGQIAGKILSHDYKALSGATVIAQFVDDQSAADDAAENAILNGNVDSVDPLNGVNRLQPTTRVETVTDKKGLFVLTGLASGTYQIFATHSRQQDSASTEYVVTQGATIEDVEIQLRPAGGVTGQVFGKNGKPLSAAAVSLRTPTPAGASGGLASLV